MTMPAMTMPATTMPTIQEESPGESRNGAPAELSERESYMPTPLPQFRLDEIFAELLKQPAEKPRERAVKEVVRRSPQRPKKKLDSENGSEIFALAPGRHTVVQQPARVSEDRISAIEKEVMQYRPRNDFLTWVREYVCEKCAGNPALLYRSCGVSRGVYAQLINNPERAVSKETVVALAFGMQLSLREAERFVRTAGFSFSRKGKDDRVYAACFKFRCCNILQVNTLLDRFGVSKRLPINFE